METLAWILLFSQLIFSFVAGVYFFTNIKDKYSAKNSIFADSKEELEKMNKLRAIKLNKPLTELTRPKSLEEIKGQNKGLKSLKAAICSPNPQHVIIYGPPGVGKTAAARVMLEEARKLAHSPFTEKSPFIELDAATLQFDERSIADPLNGSVHDPIYHGGGSYSQAGIPQPKPGAVTKAHGGILFIDEIGELHNAQMNRLLKVLEDRKVFLNSSYYSKSNPNIPNHIHDVFINGLPADFRLIGATTRRPEEIPPALRSRCKEIFFAPLSKSHLYKISEDAIFKTGLKCNGEGLRLITASSKNGRDAVNLVQSASSYAFLENKDIIEISHVEEVLEQTGIIFTNKQNLEKRPRIGRVYAPVVTSGGKGRIIDVEAAAIKADSKEGSLKITGIAETEEISSKSGGLLRKSSAFTAAENAVFAINSLSGSTTSGLEVHVHFSSSALVDGPSAGCAVFCAVYSAIHKLPILSDIAITGEMSILGKIRPVGGISEKLEACAQSGIRKIYLPADNFCEDGNVEAVQISDYKDLLKMVFGLEDNGENKLRLITKQTPLL